MLEKPTKVEVGQRWGKREWGDNEWFTINEVAPDDGKQFADIKWPHGGTGYWELEKIPQDFDFLGWAEGYGPPVSRGSAAESLTSSADSAALGSSCSPADVPLKAELWEVDPAQPQRNPSNYADRFVGGGVYRVREGRDAYMMTRHGALFRIDDNKKCSFCEKVGEHNIANVERMRPKAHAAPTCECGKAMEGGHRALEVHGEPWVCIPCRRGLASVAAFVCLSCKNGLCAEHASHTEEKSEPKAAASASGNTKSQPSAPTQKGAEPVLTPWERHVREDYAMSVKMWNEGRHTHGYPFEAKPPRLEPSKRYPPSDDPDLDLCPSWEW